MSWYPYNEYTYGYGQPVQDSEEATAQPWSYFSTTSENPTGTADQQVLPYVYFPVIDTNDGHN